MKARVLRSLDALAWRIAWLLPRKVALYAFVRVYGNWGECGADYAPVYEAWESATNGDAVARCSSRRAEPSIRA